MGHLSDRFLHQLQHGILKPFLDLVLNDHTVCLEIREDAINIYYRGGNLARIAHENGVFTASFDRNYLDPRATWVPFKIIPGTRYWGTSREIGNSSHNGSLCIDCCFSFQLNPHQSP